MNNQNMKRGNEKHYSLFNNKKHVKRGPSSFNIHDSTIVFESMNINQGDTFVDLGCGVGEYSLYAAQIVGKKGKVYAVDVWTEMLNRLKKEAESLNLDNIITIENDICQSININDDCADHCLLATVMHAQKITGKCKNLFPEIVRILKPGAELAIIECKKEEMAFGPPLNMRISPKELEEGISVYGFQKTNYLDLGYNYMLLFKVGKC